MKGENLYDKKCRPIKKGEARTKEFQSQYQRIKIGTTIQERKVLVFRVMEQAMIQNSLGKELTFAKLVLG